MTSMSLSTLLLLVSTHAVLSFQNIDLITRTASSSFLLHFSSSNSFDYQDTLKKCAFNRSVSSQSVIQKLQQLDESADPLGFSLQEDISGCFELIFSSAVATLPFVGSMLDGYLPNRELINFDFEAKTMSLEVETFPLIPAISITGEDLKFDNSSGVLSYRVKGKDKTSEWKILYADSTIVAAKSSVTGFNVIRRI